MTNSTHPETTTRYHCPTGPEFSRIHHDQEMNFLGIVHLPLIVGITGPSKSGKTMVAKHLVTELGFRYESLSALIRKQASYLGMLSPTWQDLGEIAMRWRREKGCAVLMDVLFAEMIQRGTLRERRNVVVDGVLHPDEAKALLSRPNSAIIAIDADMKLRYDLSKHWFSKDKVLSREEFVKRDLWERGLEPKASNRPREAPNITACIDMTPTACRFVFDGNEMELLQKVGLWAHSLATLSL